MHYGSSPSALSISTVSTALIACCLWLTAAAVAQPSHLQQVRERGKLTMLCFPNVDSQYVRPNLAVLRQRGVPLTELRDPSAYEGEDVELMRGFAASLGVQLEILPITTSYGDLVQALVDGQGDLIASSLSITDQRRRILDFSRPTGSIWVVVAVPLSRQVDQLTDLAGLRGAAMRGSSQLELFQAVAPPDVKMVLTDFSLETYVAVIEGEADFLLMDSAAPLGQPPKPGLDKVKVALRLKETPYGIALPKGSDLLPLLNAFLAAR